MMTLEEMIPAKFYSALRDLKHHKTLRMWFMVFKVLLGTLLAFSLFYMIIGLPGQSDFETMYGAYNPDEPHSTTWFMIQEALAAVVALASYYGMKLFSYLVYVQDCYLSVLEDRISQLLHINLMFGDDNEGSEYGSSPRVRLME